MKIIECPRDAMQGITEFIPTELKTEYLNLLLKVGFDTLDFGSFVSAKAIPQLRDTAEVLAGLQLDGVKTKLLAIVANTRGAEEAAQFDEITYLGFPFSISPTFQLRNTNKSIEEALKTVEELISICGQKGKQPVVYLSMGFGNPYGDAYSEELVADYSAELINRGANILALSDTIGSSDPQQIIRLFTHLKTEFPKVEFGAHLHSTPAQAEEKVQAVIDAGIYRLDCAIKGFGGCPMAKDELTGNLATEIALSTLKKNGLESGLNMEAFDEAFQFSSKVFAHY